MNRQVPCTTGVTLSAKEDTRTASRRLTFLLLPSVVFLKPLRRVPTKSIIIQFAKGDGFVPNPTTTALLRAWSSFCTTAFTNIS